MMPLLMTRLGKLSSALAGEVALGSTGTKGALPCAQASVVEASSIATKHVFCTLLLLGSEEIIGVGPALALARLERDGDIGLQAVSRADGPHVDLGDRLIAADALAKARLSIGDGEIVVAGAIAESVHQADGGHARRDRRDIADDFSVQLHQFRLQRLFRAPRKGRGDDHMLAAGAEGKE